MVAPGPQPAFSVSGWGAGAGGFGGAMPITSSPAGVELPLPPPLLSPPPIVTRISLPLAIAWRTRFGLILRVTVRWCLRIFNFARCTRSGLTPRSLKVTEWAA